MNFKKTGEASSTKERLETSFALVQFILEQRLDTEDPGFAWGIERGLVARELDELEADLHSLRPPQARDSLRYVSFFRCGRALLRGAVFACRCCFSRSTFQDRKTCG